MQTRLAWHNLLHSKMRTAAAVAGVAFSVVLIFMQLGFLGSVEYTATAIYESLDFDIMIRSREYLHVGDARSFSDTRLYRACATRGVQSVAPVYVELNQWRNPLNGRRRGILVLGADPAKPAFRQAEMARKSSLLRTAEALLMDRESRREFGPQDGHRFSDRDIGTTAELGAKTVRIVGHFGLATGLTADGAVLLNHYGFCRVFPGRRASQISLGLIRVDEPSRTADVARRLRHALPEDVEVLTRAAVIERERDRWINQTSIGLIFQLGVGLAFLVGTAIVYQVLATDVANHLKEYATLKAMGYGNRYLSGVVLGQAGLLAVCGFVPGVVLAVALYRITSFFSNVPVTMNAGRLAFVFVLALVMCALSGLVAVRKVRTADPADLF